VPAGRSSDRGGRAGDEVSEVRMPKPGDAITEATVAQILVPTGSPVQEGQVLYVLETDKVDMEIAAPASGTVRWVVEEGATHAVGTLLAEIE
jgi:pyruvate/2-oxoglutarate dehydrogenase complex dihydrolipoamide acyltransferase (E2) component